MSRGASGEPAGTGLDLPAGHAAPGSNEFSSAGPGRIDSVEIQFRRLGDQLAEGVKSRAGGGRYDRWAVLPFTELGPEVEKNQLGELSTKLLENALQADHGFLSINHDKLMEVVREKQLLHVLVFEEGKIRQIGRAVNGDVLVSGSVGIQAGKYVINARAANVESGQVVATARAEIQIHAFNKAAASDVLRTRYLAAGRSALLPGWGQLANHQRIKAGVVIAGTATLLGFAVYYAVQGHLAEQKYLQITDAQPGACQGALFNPQMYGSFNDCLHGQQGIASRYYKNANKFWAGLAGFYLLQIADAFVFGRNPDTAKLTAPLSPSTNEGGHSVSVDFGWQGLTLSGSF